MDALWRISLGDFFGRCFLGDALDGCSWEDFFGGCFFGRCSHWMLCGGFLWGISLGDFFGGYFFGRCSLEDAVYRTLLEDFLGEMLLGHDLG